MAERKLEAFQNHLWPNTGGIESELDRVPLLFDVRLGGAMERFSELVIERLFRQGETLVTEGQLHTSVWFFVEGKAAGRVQGSKVAIFEGHTTSVFGETTIFEPCLSSMTLVAETAGRLYSLDGAAYDQFIKEYPEVALKLQGRVARAILSQSKCARRDLARLQEAIANLKKDNDN